MSLLDFYLVSQAQSDVQVHFVYKFRHCDRAYVIAVLSDQVGRIKNPDGQQLKELLKSGSSSSSRCISEET